MLKSMDSFSITGIFYGIFEDLSYIGSSLILIAEWYFLV